ncbi:MAG TPA: sulfotransferase domain-containing protein [Candidatus Acidoferrales bacterium]|nr:sulfotransferase domain-containing protein [Candidatus Acidoferrales bacterium]
MNVKSAVKALLGRRAIDSIRARIAAVDIEHSMPGLEIAQRAGVPVFLDGEMHPRWTLDRGPVNQRVFLTTIPKAGTYMMAKLLPRLGVADCGVHVMRHGVVDHRFAPEQLRRHYPSAVGRPIALDDSIRLIAAGQFAFGHIGVCNAEIRALFADFKIVMMYRNLRDAYASFVRYYLEIRRDTIAVHRASLFHRDLQSLIAWDLDREGPYRLIGFREVCAWRREPNVLALRYEDMVGDFGRERQMEVMRELRKFLGADVDDATLADVLDTVIGQPTVTKTERRTTASEHWTPELERMYRRIGFPDLNRELGYDEPN